MKLRPYYRCVECGGDRVQATMWVELNTAEIKETETHGRNYCPDCDKIVAVRMVYRKDTE